MGVGAMGVGVMGVGVMGVGVMGIHRRIVTCKYAFIIAFFTSKGK